jgi:hypothetical protein
MQASPDARRFDMNDGTAIGMRLLEPAAAAQDLGTAVKDRLRGG